jgi:hypothetical protein
MLSAPVFYVGNDTAAVAEEMKALEIKEVVAIGDCPALEGFTVYKASLDEVNEIYVKTAAALGKPINYIAVANPKDIVGPAIIETKPYEVSGTMSGIIRTAPVVGGEIVNQQVGNTPVEFDVPDGFARVHFRFEYDIQKADDYSQAGKIEAYMYNPKGDLAREIFDIAGNVREHTMVITNTPGKWTIVPKAPLAVNVAYSIKVEVSALENSWCPDIMNLSASAAPLAVYRHGIILADESFGLTNAAWSLPQSPVEGGRMSEACVNDSNYHVGVIRDKVNATVKMLTANGMGLDAEGKGEVLLALVGGPVAIPFLYYPYQQTFVNGEVNDFVPMDVAYSNINADDEFIYQLSVGRLVSRNLGDSLEIIGREINYAKLAEQAYGSLSSVATWKDSATFYAGNYLLESNWPVDIIYTQMGAQQTGGFTTYGNYGPTANDPILSTQIESSNFVWFNVHGSPYGIVEAGLIEPTGAVTQSSWRVADYNLGPGVCFASSCLTARIDDINPDVSFALAWLHAGYVAYVGSTRSSVGSTVPSYGPLDGGCSNAITTMTMMELINNNVPIGVAFKNAKNAYVETYGAAGTHEYTLKEFVLYGDPGFNPYEPCNAG